MEQQESQVAVQPGSELCIVSVKRIAQHRNSRFYPLTLTSHNSSAFVSCDMVDCSEMIGINLKSSIVKNVNGHGINQSINERMNFHY